MFNNASTRSALYALQRFIRDVEQRKQFGWDTATIATLRLIRPVCPYPLASHWHCACRRGGNDRSDLPQATPGILHRETQGSAIIAVPFFIIPSKATSKPAGRPPKRFSSDAGGSSRSNIYDDKTSDAAASAAAAGVTNTKTAAATL